MQTKTITVYTIQELSEESREKALSNWVADNEYFWGAENVETLNKFAEAFNLKIKDYCYGDYSGRDGVDWKFEGDYADEIMELSGIRLLSYLENNVGMFIHTGKYYSLYSKIEMNPHYPTMGKNKNRKSKIQFTHDCPLTGYYIDTSILDPVYKFLTAPDKNVTFESLIIDCMREWVKACSSDIVYSNSMESFIEACECNNYTFTEDGEMENV